MSVRTIEADRGSGQQALFYFSLFRLQVFSLESIAVF